MIKNNWLFKWTSVFLIMCMMVSMLSAWMPVTVYGAESDKTILMDGTKIGNATVEADNAFRNFNVSGGGFASSPGFKQTEQDKDITIYADGTMTADDEASVTFEVKVLDNPVLKAVAAGGEAEIVVGWDELQFDESCFLVFCSTSVTEAYFYVDGVEVLRGHSGDDDRTIGYTETTATIKPNSTIVINVKIEDEDVAVKGIFIKFQDKIRPELSSYTFNGTGVERVNKKQKYELYAKAGEDISLTYNFSEPVRPSALSSGYHDHFLRHSLFTTPSDGLPTANLEQFMTNRTYKASDFSGNFLNVPLKQEINYTYTAQKYHHSDNLPLEPRMKASDGLPGINRGPIDYSMEEKLNDAVFVDAAGNVAKPITLPVKASNSSLTNLKGNVVNPFDHKGSGYRVIVDAVAPKYSRVGNGIQPEVVTGATVNNHDVMDFTVQFSEEVIARREGVSPAYADDKVYLLFNNGMRAYYYEGDNDAAKEKLGYQTPNVRFRMVIPDGVQVETPLLKVLALTHDRKDNYPDTDFLAKDKEVIQDYAGNLLIQPANYLGVHVDGDTSNVNSLIDWAKFSVDNTDPIIDFHYENDGATDTLYKKRGKITIDVNDPPVPIPTLDPDYEPITNFERPSRGIYRPSNMSGPASPAVGLVYYMWSRSDTVPADIAKEHYAAIKRFSLTAKQPKEDLYPNVPAFENFNLSVVNNKTNMIAPPAEAFTEAGSGTWYLHTWTSDMTWDTAREIMQYAAMRSFPTKYPQQYKAWMDEFSGSEADKIFYANNKALIAAAQYEDMQLWPLENFRQDDSNWSYKSAPILIDNKGPSIQLSNKLNDGTANVEVTTTITDEHSGFKEGYYQWAKAGSEPEDINWKPIMLSGGQFTVGTRNEVPEDGDYILHIKATDVLGNESTNALSSPAKVDSTAQVKGSFSNNSGTAFVQSHDVTFYLNRPVPLTVSSVTYSTYAPTVTGSAYGLGIMALTALPYEVKYAFHDSSARPGDDSAYTSVEGNEGSIGGYEYRIPADASLNGTKYLHITVKEAAADRYYYFSQSYKFDNTPPTVEFSLNEDLYPRAKHEVSFQASDSLNDTTSQYQWVKKGEAAPLASSTTWRTLAKAGDYAIVDSAHLAPGESEEYKLYVYAKDAAGNEVVTSTSGYFKISKPVIQPPANAKSDLLYVSGDQEEGYTAIVQLSLDVLDKSGYEYSVSPDYGQSWVKWKPYTNFVAVKVPSSKVQNGQIQVRYKTGPLADGSEGVIGEAKPLNIASVSDVEPVYALSTLSTNSPVSSLRGVDIDITAPLGIKVVPSAVNPSAPVRSGNRFHVEQNGYYSFDLTDTSNPDRKATLYAVVSNIDTTPPTGVVEKLIAGQEATNGNVTVKLKPSEPVHITNNNGSNTYTFKNNGSFTFEFVDEAGNSGTASYTVSTIDREGPKAIIVRSYTKADGTEYRQLDTDNGKLIEGVKLTVEKEEGGKEIIIPAGMPGHIYMTENGVAEFTVYDRLGNMTIVRETVTNIVGAPQADSVQYTLVDEAGNPLPESSKVKIGDQLYAKGKMQVTISGKTAAPNQVFLGTGFNLDPVTKEPIDAISTADGAFTTSRLFSADGAAVIAISDRLGNINKVPVTVKGLDNKAPELTLNAATVGIALNKPDFDLKKDLGGYTVRDNVSSTENINVSISGLDLTKTGKQLVTYTAEDQVGNTSTATQEVVVVPVDGMLIFGNDVLISGASPETAIFESNKVKFKITGFNLMKVGGQELTNNAGTYDLFYYTGLFREGQMKAIATKLTYQDLINGNFEVTFPKTGWYTIIVRNQERDREYASFFISKLN
ncbi:hypothetical protein SAMN02799630_03805 [Paenibacillus sp. UNCCL117]|uniref:DUF5011 domain-containing protein n=1 Tax=unclassified Paenibacillus TaxID=185978 RepID=UPI0008869B35|nr:MULTISPECIES: DUF5011 domain-containing protein [unclassified Paenibacillus]SDD59368.1 hypothetical protein SAMN04488602_110132 [Paenibacillus sp. cl123]SFW50829.1 hypothetical protein SAMN02799630_03805 [Paenibacillus sp. UNCCL117]